eukprot:gene43384-13188_t
MPRVISAHTLSMRGMERVDSGGRTPASPVVPRLQPMTPIFKDRFASDARKFESEGSKGSIPPPRVGTDARAGKMSPRGLNGLVTPDGAHMLRGRGAAAAMVIQQMGGWHQPRVVVQECLHVKRGNIGVADEDQMTLMQLLSSWWNLLVLGTLAFNCLTVPSSVVFDRHEPAPVALLVLGYFFDLVYLVDVFGFNFSE